MHHSGCLEDDLDRQLVEVPICSVELLLGTAIPLSELGLSPHYLYLDGANCHRLQFKLSSVGRVSAGLAALFGASSGSGSAWSRP